MKERIKKIMESEDMTPARFADTLQIGRAVISHILNGRNNPSLDIITKILAHMPQIDSDWLLTGKGDMYRTSDTEKQESASRDLFSEPDLFSQPAVVTTITEQKQDERPQNSIHTIANGVSEVHEVVREKIIYQERPEKKVSQIIIYYNDNTFEIFQTPQKT